MTNRHDIFTGVITALITPFKENKIDFDALNILINRQIECGIKSIVIAGSTGEGHSLLTTEYYDLIMKSLTIAKKRINIIAGVSTVSTAQALDKIEKLNCMGVDGLMCTVPHYIIPTQEGIYEHFHQISSKTILPVMVYIHPKRTGVNLSEDTIYAVAKLNNILAIKDASSDIERILRISTNIHHYSNNFNILTGDDINMIACASHGGTGVVSVISNLLPKSTSQLFNKCLANDFLSALTLQRQLLEIYNHILAINNPIGIKLALNIIGLCSDEVRLPLSIPTSHEISRKIRDSLVQKFTDLNLVC